MIISGDIPNQFIEAAYNTKQVGIDIETTGLDKIHDRLATIQLYTTNYDPIILQDIDDVPLNLMRLLEEERIRKIFHHALFDLTFIMRDYPYINPVRIADTKIAAKLYDPDKTIFGSHSLKTLLKKIFNIELDKSLSTSDWEQDLTPAQIDYAIRDVVYLPALLNWLECMITDHATKIALQHTYNYIPTKVMLDLKLGRDVFGYE